MKLSIVVAMDPNGVIGRQGKIPWDLPDDLKHFARLTKGHPVIMGRKTYESIGFPLKERTNIVLSSQAIKIQNCMVVRSFEEAIREAEKTGADECFVIGGNQVYKQALPFVTKMYITTVKKEYWGDTYFPKFNIKDWQMIYEQRELSLNFTIFRRRLENSLNFAHSRELGQRDVMTRAQQDGKCPFCWKNLVKYHPKPILKKGKWWWVSENAWPYKGTATHLMFFYKDHIVSLSKLKPQAAIELMKLVAWAEKEFGIKGGGLFIRFGETSRTGSSVEHLHAQLIVGNSIKNPDSEPLRVKLGYIKK